MREAELPAISGIFVGVSLVVLGEFPPGPVLLCVTSPPYWGLRDYGVEDQIGAESEIGAYIETLTAIFDQVRRVLCADGTLWLNIGDSYPSGNRKWRGPAKKNGGAAMDYRPPDPKA